LTVLSQLLEAKYLPSGENAREWTSLLWTSLLWPYNVVTSFRDSMLQSLTVLSPLPEAKYLPSGENTMDLT
jgi:hypothetical protein